MNRLTRPFTDGPAEARWLSRFGALLVLTGLFHVGVWAVLGGPLEGPVSWRKPIVFGLSAGVTTLSLGWVVGQLAEGPWRRRLAKLYLVFMSLEIFLIDLQQWRGVPSHFNVASPLDGAIFSLMGIFILIASAPVVIWSVQAVRARHLAPDRRLAIGAGMLLLDAAIGLGILLAAIGSARGASGGTPATASVFGAAGLMKVPHGVAMHGLQLLPLLFLLLSGAISSERLRVRLLASASAGYVLLLASTVLTAFSGRAPLDLAPSALVLAALGTLLVALPFGYGALGRWHLRGSSPAALLERPIARG